MIDFRRSDPAIAEDLLEFISPRTSPDLARGIIEAIGRSDSAATGTAIIERLGALSPAVRGVAIRILLSRGDWTNSLIDAVGAGKLSFSELSLDQKQALAAHPDKKVAARGSPELLAPRRRAWRSRSGRRSSKNCCRSVK